MADVKEEDGDSERIDAGVNTALLDLDPSKSFMARQRLTSDASIINRPIGEQGELRTASSSPKVSFGGMATPNSSPPQSPRWDSVYGINTPSSPGRHACAREARGTSPILFAIFSHGQMPTKAWNPLWRSEGPPAIIGR